MAEQAFKPRPVALRNPDCVPGVVRLPCPADPESLEVCESCASAGLGPCDVLADLFARRT